METFRKMVKTLKERLINFSQHWFKNFTFFKSSKNLQIYLGRESILPILTTRGFRTSTMATRTTTTRTTVTMHELSAISPVQLHQPFEISFKDLIIAYTQCRKHKSNKNSAIKFEIDLEENLWNLYNHIMVGTYKTSRAICFGIFSPTAREVWASNFQDRIIQHLLINEISDKFNRKFHQNSCACIKNRGTQYGILKLEKKCKSITQNYKNSAYYLKCDVSNFFMSIDQKILKTLILNKIGNNWISQGLIYMIDSDLRTNFKLNTPLSVLDKIPNKKRFSKCSKSVGLPIGNLTSQFFANLYLNELDQFVKHKLKISYYVRYVDDFVILSKDAHFLYKIKNQVNKFLNLHLNLFLNYKKCYLNKIENGLSFCGQTIKPFRRIIRFSSKCRAMGKILKTTKPEVFVSFLGMFRRASKSFNDRVIIGFYAFSRGFILDQKLTKII